MPAELRICLLCEGVTESSLERCASCGATLFGTHEVHYPRRRGEEDAAHPLLGARVDGKYRITGVLGKGGMGTVFLATHEVSLVPVALKVLHPRYGQRADHRAWFLSEARKAGRVVHEHSARITDVGEAEDGTVYLAMELVQGLTLGEWMQGARKLPPVLVAQVLMQIGEALAAAHEVGVVHRDLTPRNVMVVEREGRPFVKILDFGIARGQPRALEGAEAGGVDPAGFASPPYSAPEHLLGEETDPRADLYSLGVLAYEMLSGERPVAGESRRELVQATIEGALRPLPAVAGAPVRLVRLVSRLLARAPARRPASAREVVRELQRILAPQGLVRQRIAYLATLAGTVLLVLAYAGGPAPFLRSAPETAVVLASPGGMTVLPLQSLRSDALRRLEFEYGGFTAETLRAELRQNARHVAEVVLEPRRDSRRGVLTVDGECAGHAGLLAALREHARQAAVDLALSVPGRAPLGHARIVVDDEPPVLDWTVQAGERAILAGLTAIEVRAAENQQLRQLRIEVTGSALGAGNRQWVDLEPTTRVQSLRAGELFAQVFPGVRDAGRVTLRLVATDLAGNQASTAPIPLASVDLRVAQILGAGAPGGGTMLTFSPEGARLRLRLADPEDGLEVLVTDPEQRPILPREIRPVTDSGLELLLPLPQGAGARPLLDGTYVLQLRDRCGNVGAEFKETFTFRSEDIQSEFSPREREGLGRVVVQADGLTTDGRLVALAFRCNSLYSLQSAQLRVGTEPGGSAVTPGPRWQVAGPGAAEIELPELAAGVYRLEVTLAGTPHGATREIATPVRALPVPPTLDLPATAGMRFVNELVDAGVLRSTGAGVAQGPAWGLDPPDHRLVRGRFLFGGSSLVAIPLGPSRVEGGLLPELELRPGSNRLAAELVDLFERPLQVRVGGRPAERLAPGSATLLLATFHHDPRPPMALEPAVRIEYGKPAGLTLVTALPFQAERDRQRIELVFDSIPLPPTQILARATGVQLEFTLPFERLIAATGLGRHLPGEYAAGLEGRFAARLRTPAGEWQLEVPVRTARSVLGKVRFGDLAPADRNLAPALRRLTLVPVPRPLAGNPWPEPVPAGRLERARYRLAPPLEVRNLDDCYLQQSEMTVAEYEALVAAFLALPPAARPLAAQLQHAGDPLGEARLTREGFAWRGLAAAPQPNEPVRGIDYFQAYALARVAGALCGDPNLFRLPLGVELERAALAALPAPASLPLADRAMTELGDEVFGLHGGVREWVADLPCLAPASTAGQLLEWLGDADRHLERIAQLAAGALQLQGLVPELLQNGVVRGQPAGDAAGLPAVGVLGTLHLRRDGMGLLPGEVDPRLGGIGMRLAGGAVFVRQVRPR